jgi:hypothetical protein
MKPTLPALAALLLSACVPYPGDAPQPEDLGGAAPLTAASFRAMDGGVEQDSVHFKVTAHGADTARQVADQAETLYQSISNDSGMAGLAPTAVSVYGSADEYRSRTSQASWSDGAVYDGAVYVYYGPRLAQALAHYLTHAAYSQFMGRDVLENRWVSEGLACYEESKAAGDAGVPVDLFSGVRSTMRMQPFTMDQLEHLAPATENARSTSLWYAESESLVAFMIERGGQADFGQFLQGLKDGKGFNDAISSAFVGIWRNLGDVYQAWQTSQQ